MPLPPLIDPRRRVRVVLSSTALLAFMSVRKAAALALAQLGIGAFFVSRRGERDLGASAGWFVLAADVLAAIVRAIDIESWAVFIPGGFVGRVTRPSGRPGRGPRRRRSSSSACCSRALAVVKSGTTRPA